MRGVSFEGIGGKVVALIFAIVLVGGTVASGIAGDAAGKISPLFAYRHEKAVASMREGTVPRTSTDGGEVPNVPSVVPWSWCIGSLCATSWCGGSLCVGSFCGISGCQGSSCVGSVCVMSGCVVSACAVETTCIRTCDSPSIPADPVYPEPNTWSDCTFGACGLNP